MSQVEKQEKKKTPKGRAKKRITYTRRFVNVTMTGGKRKVRGMDLCRGAMSGIKGLTQFWQMNPNPTT